MSRRFPVARALFACAFGHRAETVACVVDAEHSATDLFFHVDLPGVELQPGDSVVLQGAPDIAAAAERRAQHQCTARVVRAGAIRRGWTRLMEFTQLTELYEVSFSPWRKT